MGDKLLASAERTRVVEGNHYFPPEGVRPDLLSPSGRRYLCPKKGLARYLTFDGGGERAAWSYDHPFPWYRRIRDHVAFGEGVEVRED